MTDVPVFKRYSQANASVPERLQPKLELRDWDALSKDDKKNVIALLIRLRWLDQHPNPALSAVSQLNREYMRILPGKRVHNTVPNRSYHGGEDYDLLLAGYHDFCDIVLTGTHDMVMELLSLFIQAHIDTFEYQRARKEAEPDVRRKVLNGAFEKFDRLANCLNDVFAQFGINQVVSRTGFAPRQDAKIQETLFEPTMALLADPKWKPVSDDLADMFSEFRERRYSETITKAHSATQRFFQILAGEGNNGKGELSKLVGELRKQGIIPNRDNFVEPVATALLGFLPSERAQNSTAKPTTQDARPEEALLVINVVLVLIQFCLQRTT